MCILLASCARAPVQEARYGLDAIEHIIVIYAENRSFDNLYGLFPGANGIANATPERYTQVDHGGKPFQMLPPVWEEKDEEGQEAQCVFPVNLRLQNKPFQIDGPRINCSMSKPTRDLTYRYYQNIEQINCGRNNLFAAISNAGGLVMGYYDGSKLPMWKWEGVCARRQLLRGSVRRILSQPLLVGLRMHTAGPACTPRPDHQDRQEVVRPG